jgi:predicted RecB family nuclease
VTQLSYTFRPRRQPKRLHAKQEKYHHSLKALAIRENKIHIIGSPELMIEGTPTYLDVEGLPDSEFYYLIGLRIIHSDSIVQHSLWADEPADEERIWNEFLDLIATVNNPILLHYGSYETKFIKAMSSRYGTSRLDSGAEKVFSSAINLLSIIYGHVYFPVATNGLKDIASYCGFQWSQTLASGLHSIVIRQKWEIFGNIEEREKLIQYNTEDCEALAIVVQKIFGLHCSQADNSTTDSSIVDVTKFKREHPYGFKRNNFVVQDFETINKAAYWDYQRERVYLKTNPALKKITHRLPIRVGVSFFL